MAADTALSRPEIDRIVEEGCNLVDETTIGDATAYLLGIHKAIEQHPDCTLILRKMLTLEGALFGRIIQTLDLEAWKDGLALLQEENDG